MVRQYHLSFNIIVTCLMLLLTTMYRLYESNFNRLIDQVPRCRRGRLWTGSIPLQRGRSRISRTSKLFFQLLCPCVIICCISIISKTSITRINTFLLKTFLVNKNTLLKFIVFMLDMLEFIVYYIILKYLMQLSLTHSVYQYINL